MTRRDFVVGRMFLCMGLVLSFFAFSSPTQAATTITQTTGTGNLGTVVLPPNGNVYGITGGKPVGTNLFHSFGQFSVGTGDIAQFQTTSLIPNNAMSNILGRVTGGNPSSIFGTIDSATYYPGANLFLMNPYGIIFGPNATLNVGGSVTFTTADYLKLAGNVRFEAIPGPQDVLLNASPVAAFGFLGSNPAAIAVQGSQLTVANGTDLSFVGGNRGFTYIDPDTGHPASAPDGVTVTGGRLSAPNGAINLAVTASPGEFLVADLQPTPNINGESFTSYGSIHLAPDSTIDVSGANTVSIRGGQFVLSVSDSVLTTAVGPSVPNNITLNRGSSIVTSNTGPEPGADIEITGVNILISDGSGIATTSSGSGKGGDIHLTMSGDVSLTGGGNVGVSGRIGTDSLGSGSGGSITVSSSSMTVADLGVVETRSFGTGPSGNITIDTTTLNVEGGGLVQTVSASDVSPTGNITIRATDSVTITGTGDITSTSAIINENDGGGTGNISIETGQLQLSNQARIFSLTLFDSDPAAANQAKISVAANSINLTSGSRIDVIGGFISDVGRLEVSAQNLTMSGLSAMSTLTNGPGTSGPILVNVQNLSLSEGSQILSSSELGAGRGGDITINATGSVVLTGQGTDQGGITIPSGVFSRTLAGFEDPSFTGNAGNISITGQSIEVSNGARVDSSSQFFALGNAGNIDLTAPTITVNGGTISTSTEFAGQAGSIALHANTVTLNNGGQLTSSSIVRQTPLFDGEVIPLPSGNAGNVTIQGLASPAQSVLIDGPGSGIFTNTQGTGAGGNILIETGQSTTLKNGAAVSASSTGTMDNAGDAGMVTIHAGNTFLMQDSFVTTQSTKGGGGQIEINASNLFRLVNSKVSSSVLDGTGGGGNITIDPNVVVLQNSQILAQAIQGNGGNITITTPQFLADQTSLVSASSQFGLNGPVTIQRPTSNLSESLGPLTSKPSQTQSLLTQRCAALANGQASSFVVAGREQLPADPGGWLTSPLALARIDAERFGDGTVAYNTPAAMAIHDTDRVSLRRLTPAGFLIANFADSEATGCHS